MIVVCDKIVREVCCFEFLYTTETWFQCFHWLLNDARGKLLGRQTTETVGYCCRDCAAVHKNDRPISSSDQRKAVHRKITRK